VTDAEVKAIYAELGAAQAAIDSLRQKFTAALMRADDGREFLVKSCQSKRSYKTPEAAGNAAASAKEKSGDTLRVYGCPMCRGFHLTKGDLEDFVRRAG
jgi:hypothetical protein